MAALELVPQPLDGYPDECTIEVPADGVTFTGGKGIVLGIVTSIFYPVGVNLTVTHGSDPPFPVSLLMAAAPMQSLAGPFPEGVITITFDVTDGVLVGLFQA